MDLQRVWETEIEILDQIDAFCREHGLKYSLAYGTLLGAVRHGGFIPWDDDIDIIMPRKDYEYLLSRWNVPGFILQNKRTNDDFTQNFSKIRKDHTAYLQEEFEKTVTYHTGIFVDIFPMDRVAPEGIARKYQLFCAALNLLYSREFTSGGRSAVVEKILLAVPRRLRLKICARMEREIQKWDDSNSSFFSTSTIRDAEKLYSRYLFLELADKEFAGKGYMCIRDYDTFLTKCYGDYMQLPPIEDRKLTHHPVFVDFEQNYNEISHT